MAWNLKNPAASVHQRLLNQAKASARPFHELLQYYSIERFLYRLSRSAHADRFILKGALMFSAWSASVSRPTKDIDLLGRMDNRPEAIVAAIQDACGQKVEADGMVFNAATVTAARIAEENEYQGVRVRVQGNLGPARVSLQVDIGFGDVIVPRPRKISFPTLLDFPPPQLHGYSRESVIAEKFQAMVKLGVLNSRMKDFYDLWLLSRKFDFQGRTLAAAVEKTFARRKTALSSQPTVFQDTFVHDEGKQTQWRAFVKKSKLEDAPKTLAEVVAPVQAFLGPLAAALAKKKTFLKVWIAPGPWR